MTHLSQRPVRLLTLLQALTVLVMFGGTGLACMLGYIGVLGLVFVWGEGLGVVSFVVLSLLTVVVVSACSYVTLICFLNVLQRMKTDTAFTAKNCDALGTMAASCGIAAATLLAIMVYWTAVSAVSELMSVGTLTPSSFVSLGTLFAILLVWPFGFGVVALLIQGVRLLMIRAMRLEREQAFVV